MAARTRGGAEERKAADSGRAATDPGARVMRLREAKPLGVLDRHQWGVRYIGAHLDHGGGDEQLDAARLELEHRRVLGAWWHAAWRCAVEDL